MPIYFSEDSNRFEGENLYGETLARFDFSVFGGLITNSGTIAGPVTARTADWIEIYNTLDGTISKASGSPYAIELLGAGGKNFYNDGLITGGVRFGTGWDSFFNSGFVQGQINLGSGDDQLVNQIIPGIDGGVTIGTITGGVFMGAGKDTVVNTGIMANVSLGAGEDEYRASLSDFREFPATADGIADAVFGQGGNDLLIGGRNADKFFGGTDDDQLNGYGGNDQLFSPAGHAPLFAGDGNDKVNGGGGDDFIDGGNNNDNLSGAAGNDTIFAGTGNDKVNGGNDDDIIHGDAGNDQLNGGSGNDTILGGLGRDTMTGGAGADEFVFAANSGKDVIRDLGAGDTITIDLPLDVLDGFTQIMSHTTFTGPHAVIDLSGLFNDVSEAPFIYHGSELTLLNVGFADLSPFTFGLLPDILIVG